MNPWRRFHLPSRRIYQLLFKLHKNISLTILWFTNFFWNQVIWATNHAAQVSKVMVGLRRDVYRQITIYYLQFKKQVSKRIRIDEA